MIITFLTVVAWAGAIGGTIMTIVTWWSHHDYHHGGPNGGDSLQKTIEAMQGVTTVHNVGRFLIIALLSWAWLITTWLH